MSLVIKISNLFLIILLFFPSIIFSSDLMNKSDLEKFILDTIRKEPQVILDILRNNSEAVLDIAQQGSNLKKLNGLKKQWTKDLTVKKKIRCSDRPILGSLNSKVTIVAFSDFSCHYCQSSKSVVDKILKEFNSKINFIFKSIPIDEKGNSALAAAWFLAIAQQDEKKAWQFYNIMFDEKDKLLSEGIELIKKTAKNLNLDIKKLEQDVKSNKKIKNILKEDREDADNLNVEGTPCFFVNNIVIKGAVPLDIFRAAVIMALDDAEKK